MGKGTVRVSFAIIAVLFFAVSVLFPAGQFEYFTEQDHINSTRIAKFQLTTKTDITPESYNQGDLLVGMLRLEFTALGGAPTSSGDIYGLTVTHNGTGAKEDVESVSVFLDTDDDDAFEPETDDTFLGENKTWSAQNTTGITFTPAINIMRDATKTIFIAYNFSLSASGTHGAGILANTDVNAEYMIEDPSSVFPASSKNVPLNGTSPPAGEVDVIEQQVLKGGSPASNANCGDMITLTAKATNTNGSASINGMNILIRDPNFDVYLSSTAMTEGSVGTNYKIYSFELTIETQPNAPKRGEYTVSFTGDFAQGNKINTTIFTIVNTPPVINGTIDPLYLEEDDPKLNKDLAGSASDKEDAPADLTWEASWTKTDLIKITITGSTLSIEILSEVTDQDEVTLTVTDTDGEDASTKFMIYITSVNDPPEIINQISDRKILEDSDPFEMDLSAFGDDPEDGFSSDKLVWSVTDVNTSLLTVTVEGDLLTFSPVENAWGVDDVNITLTDSEGLTDWQRVEIEVVPINDPPEWMDIKDIYLDRYSDMNNVITLSDHIIDIDGEVPTFEIKDNSNPDEVKADLDKTNNIDLEILEETFSGEFKLTVSVNDGDTTVDKEITFHYEQVIIGKVQTYLSTPADVSTVGSMQPTLKWLVDVPDGATGEVKFDVYLGKEAGSVSSYDTSTLESSGIKDSSYETRPLEDNETYYWTVVPFLNDVEGICISGTWSFQVNTSFDIIREVTVNSMNTSNTMNPGERKNITFEIKNTGNNAETVTVSVDPGTLPGTLIFDPSGNYLIEPGKSIELSLEIIIDNDAESGFYTFDVVVNSSDGEPLKTSEFQVVVLDQGTDEPSSPLSSVLIIIIIIILALILIGITVFLVIFYRGTAKVEALYVIHLDGRLMYSKVMLNKDGEEEADGEILSGMFTAIQDLMDDTFKTEGKGFNRKKIEFGGKNVLIQKGKSIYSVLVAEGRPGRSLESKMERSIMNFESNNPDIEDWDGDRDSLKLETYFEGHFK